MVTSSQTWGTETLLDTRDLSEMLKPVFQIMDGYAITCLKELVVGTATIAASNVTQINSYWKARTASGI